MTRRHIHLAIAAVLGLALGLSLGAAGMLAADLSRPIHVSLCAREGESCHPVWQVDP